MKSKHQSKNEKYDTNENENNEVLIKYHIRYLSIHLDKKNLKILQHKLYNFITNENKIK